MWQSSVLQLKVGEGFVAGLAVAHVDVEGEDRAASGDAYAVVGIELSEPVLNDCRLGGGMVLPASHRRALLPWFDRQHRQPVGCVVESVGKGAHAAALNGIAHCVLLKRSGA